jgi:hypothetical protein
VPPSISTRLLRRLRLLAIAVCSGVAMATAVLNLNLPNFPTKIFFLLFALEDVSESAFADEDNVAIVVRQFRIVRASSRECGVSADIPSNPLRRALVVAKMEFFSSSLIDVEEFVLPVDAVKGTISSSRRTAIMNSGGWFLIS